MNLPARQRLQQRLGPVELVDDLTDELLDEVLERDQPGPHLGAAHIGEGACSTTRRTTSHSDTVMNSSRSDPHDVEETLEALLG